jgi:hypothetical protein
MEDQSNRITAYLEVLSKGTAILAASTYVVGFLVVSIHTASFGLSSINPFRPRILTAGGWFVLFLVLPILLAMGLFSHDGLELNPEQRFARGCVSTLLLYFSSMFFGFAFEFLFDVPPSPPWFPRHEWISGALLIAVITVMSVSIKQTSQHYIKYPMPVAGISLLLVVVMIVLGIAVDRHLPLQFLGWWFFGVGIFGVMHDNILRDEKKRKENNWVAFTMIVLLGFSVFPLFIYPHIKSGWGGGSPVPVVVYFSNDSRILPGQQLIADLLEESDGGLYVAQKGQQQALFIPRTEISAIYFSDKPLDEGLLKKMPTRP